MDLAYEVIDWYKNGIILAKGEVEMEVIAVSRLGRVYDQVLKDRTRAKANYIRAIELAHSMYPRRFDTQGTINQPFNMILLYIQNNIFELWLLYCYCFIISIFDYKMLFMSSLL